MAATDSSRVNLRVKTNPATEQNKTPAPGAAVTRYKPETVTNVRRH